MAGDDIEVEDSDMEMPPGEFLVQPELDGSE